MHSIKLAELHLACFSIILSFTLTSTSDSHMMYDSSWI